MLPWSGTESEFQNGLELYQQYVYYAGREKKGENQFRKANVYRKFSCNSILSPAYFGKLRVMGTNREAYVANFVDELLKSVQALYNEELENTIDSGKAYPSVTSLLPQKKSC